MGAAGSRPSGPKKPTEHLHLLVQHARDESRRIERAHQRFNDEYLDAPLDPTLRQIEGMYLSEASTALRQLADKAEKFSKSLDNTWPQRKFTVRINRSGVEGPIKLTDAFVRPEPGLHGAKHAIEAWTRKVVPVKADEVVTATESPPGEFSVLIAPADFSRFRKSVSVISLVGRKMHKIEVPADAEGRIRGKDLIRLVEETEGLGQGTLVPPNRSAIMPESIVSLDGTAPLTFFPGVRPDGTLFPGTGGRPADGVSSPDVV